MCEDKNFTYGKTVYAEGDPSSHVYLVKNGEFELVKKLPRRKNPHEPTRRGQQFRRSQN